MSSACATSLCKGCTAAAAAVPRPPSLPPGERLEEQSHTHPCSPWKALAAALVPLAVSLLLTSCLLLSKLLPRAAATAGAWIPPGLRQKNAGELFFSPATALLLLLLAVTGATLVLLQGNLLPLSPSLGPGVGGGEQHGDPPPASGGGHAGDLLAAPALAPHHMHQSGLSVAKKAHSNLRVHTGERYLHGGVDGLALVLPGGCGHHLLVHLVAPLPPALGASFKRGGGGGKCHGEEEEGEEEEEKRERGHLHLSCLDLSGRKLRKMENL